MASWQPPLLAHTDQRTAAGSPPPRNLFPCRALLEAGVKIAFGTDTYPASEVVPPLASLEMALERARTRRLPHHAGPGLAGIHSGCRLCGVLRAGEGLARSGQARRFRGLRSRFLARAATLDACGQSAHDRGWRPGALRVVVVSRPTNAGTQRFFPTAREPSPEAVGAGLVWRGNLPRRPSFP